MTITGQEESGSPLEALRRLCLAFPKTSERLSHGEPTWFVQERRAFVMYADHHHDDRLAFWCAAPPWAQATRIVANPDQFFIPPYVGHRRWLGVRLDVPTDWDEIAGLVEDAYRTIAPKALVTILDEAALQVSADPSEAARLTRRVRRRG